MPSNADRAAAALALLLALASCAGEQARPRAARRYRPVADLPVKIGPAYSVRGRRYVPADDRGYDAVGMASWYGPESGGQTANGERFRPDWIGGAHRTLPLPSYVEVTALRSGRTILVRINDRGPFAPDRVIDLSRGAARLLGMERDGTGPVRVRRVFPPESDRAALRAGRPASGRPTLPPAARAALLARMGTPSPASRTVADEHPVVPAGALHVQVATLSAADRAAALARELGGRVEPAGGRYRVRIGPVAEGDAQAILARVRAAGYQDARLVRDPGPSPQFMEAVR